MTDYKPRVGDRVRRTHHNGTVIEGIIDHVTIWGNAGDSDSCVLFNAYHPEETELLHRPATFKTDVGTCYRDGDFSEFVLIKVDNDHHGWLGSVEFDARWFTDEEVQKIIERGGWEDYSLLPN